MRRSLLFWIAIPMLLAISYPLSIGPAYRLAGNGHLPWRIVTPLYDPLLASVRQTPLHAPLNDYLFWCSGFIDLEAFLPPPSSGPIVVLDYPPAYPEGVRE